MRTHCLTALFPLMLAIGCGPESPADDGDGGNGVGDGGETADAMPAGPDYAGGAFVLENITTNVENLQSFRLQQAFAGSTQVGVWVENRTAQTQLDVDLHTGVRTGSEWSNDNLTDDAGVQNSFPSLVSDGRDLTVVWNGYPDVDNDIFLSRFDGADWSAAEDLTSAFETDPLLTDAYPAAALAPDGTLVVVYYSRARLEDGSNPYELRVLTVDGEGTVSDPEILIAASDDLATACNGGIQPAVAVDSSGAVHILVACGIGSSASLRYVSNASGSWDDEVVQLSEAAETSCAVAVSGGEVRAAVYGLVPCTAGSCGEIFYLRRAGSGWQETNITNTPDVADFSPELSIDRWGRSVIAYATRPGDKEDTVMTWSTGQDSFAAPMTVTPDTPDSRETPSQVTFHPDSGLPILSIKQVLSAPFRTDAVNAFLEL